MKIACAQMDVRLADSAYNYAHALELCMGESQLCEYCPSSGIDFEHNDIHCTIDFDGLRKKAGMEQ